MSGGGSRSLAEARESRGNSGRRVAADAFGLSAGTMRGVATSRCGFIGRESIWVASVEASQQGAGDRTALPAAREGHGQSHPKRVAQGSPPTSRNSSRRMDANPAAKPSRSRVQTLWLPLTCVPVGCMFRGFPLLAHIIESYYSRGTCWRVVQNTPPGRPTHPHRVA